MPKDGDELSGAGWSFPVTSDHKGDVQLVNGERSIEDSIRLILGTMKGERVMRPEFGCNIHEYAFETVDGTTLTLVERSVREALIRWEPRIDLRSVTARQDRDDPHKMLVDIEYVIRTTNAESNMVYPFYTNE